MPVCYCYPAPDNQSTRNMAKLEPLESSYYVWQYVPSVVAAVVFLILFSSATLFQFLEELEVKSSIHAFLCHWRHL